MLKVLHSYIRGFRVETSGNAGDLPHRLGVRRGIGVGHRMRSWLVRIVRAGAVWLLFAIQMKFAVAAIAAGGALLAKMIRARIFRAFDADARGLFFANATDE